MELSIDAAGVAYGCWCADIVHEEIVNLPNDCFSASITTDE